MVLTNNTVTHFQCSIHHCYKNGYSPDPFCPWWWFGAYQITKSMYTCNTSKVLQYFYKHHFRLKLNRNAAQYLILHTGCLFKFLKIIWTIVIPNSKGNEAVVSNIFQIFSRLYLKLIFAWNTLWTKIPKSHHCDWTSP